MRPPLCCILGCISNLSVAHSSVHSGPCVPCAPTCLPCLSSSRASLTASLRDFSSAAFSSASRLLR
jgi:hypothetical protein